MCGVVSCVSCPLRELSWAPRCPVQYSRALVRLFGATDHLCVVLGGIGTANDGGGAGEEGGVARIVSILWFCFGGVRSSAARQIVKACS